MVSFTLSQKVLACSKSIVETLEQDVKPVQSQE